MDEQINELKHEIWRNVYDKKHYVILKQDTINFQLAHYRLLVIRTVILHIGCLLIIVDVYFNNHLAKS